MTKQQFLVLYLHIKFCTQLHIEKSYMSFQMVFLIGYHKKIDVCIVYR